MVEISQDEVRTATMDHHGCQQPRKRPILGDRQMGRFPWLLTNSKKAASRGGNVGLRKSIFEFRRV